MYPVKVLAPALRILDRAVQHASRNFAVKHRVLNLAQQFLQGFTESGLVGVEHRLGDKLLPLLRLQPLKKSLHSLFRTQTSKNRSRRDILLLTPVEPLASRGLFNRIVSIEILRQDVFPGSLFCRRTQHDWIVSIQFEQTERRVNRFCF